MNVNGISESSRSVSPSGETGKFMLGCSGDFLDNRYILVHSENERVWFFDTELQKLCGELIIESHEPKATSHYHPGLTDNDLCTDIQYFLKISRRIVFVSRHDGGVGHENWSDTLTCYSVEHIIDTMINNVGLR
jgi:hypothetical protein